MIQPVFIAEQDGKTQMSLKESDVACHLRDKTIVTTKKSVCNNGLWPKRWAIDAKR